MEGDEATQVPVEPICDTVCLKECVNDPRASYNVVVSCFAAERVYADNPELYTYSCVNEHGTRRQVTAFGCIV